MSRSKNIEKLLVYQKLKHVHPVTTPFCIMLIYHYSFRRTFLIGWGSSLLLISCWIALISGLLNPPKHFLRRFYFVMAAARSFFATSVFDLSYGIRGFRLSRFSWDKTFDNRNCDYRERYSNFWYFNRQSLVSLSSAEAEYITLESVSFMIPQNPLQTLSLVCQVGKRIYHWKKSFYILQLYIS